MPHSGSALIDSAIVLSQAKLAPGMRVADLGCGRTGHFIFAAARLVGSTGAVYAVDIIKDILESLQSRIRGEGYDNIHTVWSDIERPNATPIPDGSLDVVFFVNVLSQVGDRGSALAEGARLIKQGGKILVIDWARSLGPLGPSPANRLTPAALGLLARPLGMTPLDEFAPGAYHFGMVLVKN